MKTVKKSDNRKNREKNRCSLRTRLTLLVTAELVFCVLGALGLNTLLEGLIDIDSPLMLMFALIAAAVYLFICSGMQRGIYHRLLRGR